MSGAGLCGVCRHARRIENERGSRFLLCRLSRTDERFARYPQLPVRSCPGFRGIAPREARDDESNEEAEDG